MKPPWKPIPFVGDVYADEAEAFSAQDTINLLPERADVNGTRSEWKYTSAPGLFRIGSVGTGPHRGAHDFEGKFFVVSGRGLYQILTSGAVYYRGEIPGYGRVWMEHNANGQLVIGIRSAGYVYTPADTTLTKITDPEFPGILQGCFIGQMIAGIEPLRRYWFHSEVNDATVYDSGDRYVGEAAADRLVGLVPLHSRVLALSERTGEVFVNDPVSNDGIVTASFQRATGETLEIGCAATFSLVKHAGAAWFIANDGKAYMWSGGAAAPFSTGPIERAWANCNLANAFALPWDDKNFTIVYFTFPDGKTWGYDVRRKLWHRRESFGLDRWRLNTLCEWNGQWYGGDHASGDVYLLAWKYAQEGDDPLVRMRATGVAHANGADIEFDALQLEFAVEPSRDPVHVELYEAVVVGNPFASGKTNDIVNHQFTVTGGTAPYTWEVIGDLPPGYVDEGDGLFTGFMDVIDSYAPTIKVTDAVGHVGTLECPFTISGYPFVYQISDNDGTTANRVHRTVYAEFNRYDFTFAPLATFDQTGVYPAIGHPGFVMDGYLVTRGYFDNDSPSGSQKSGLIALEYDGAALSIADRWRITGTGNVYLDHVQWDDTTVIVAATDDSDSDDCYLYAVSFIGGQFTLLGSVEIDTGLTPGVALAVHGTGADKVVCAYSYVTGRRFLKAYSFDTDTFTLEDTYGGSLASGFNVSSLTDTIVSDGDYLYVPSGQIFSWAAGAFVLEDTFVPAVDCVGLSVWKDTQNGTDRYIRFLDGDAELSVWKWDGTTLTDEESIAGDFADMGRCDTLQDDDVDPAVRPQQGEYFQPVTDVGAASHPESGIYVGADPSTLAETLTLDFDNNPDPARIAIAFLDSGLTER